MKTYITFVSTHTHSHQARSARSVHGTLKHDAILLSFLRYFLHADDFEIVLTTHLYTHADGDDISRAACALTLLHIYVICT